MEIYMRLSRRQLRRAILESIDIMNADTGELLIFDEMEGGADAPEAAARDVLRRLQITPVNSEVEGAVETLSVAPEDYAVIDTEIHGKRRQRHHKKEDARLNVDNLFARLDQWIADAGPGYAADNPGVDMQGVAMDLAAGAEFSFREDEWDELVGYFDDQLDWELDKGMTGNDALMTYIADRLAGTG
jgi:hypothetical protein